MGYTGTYWSERVPGCVGSVQNTRGQSQYVPVSLRIDRHFATASNAPVHKNLFDHYLFDQKMGTSFLAEHENAHGGGDGM